MSDTVEGYVVRVPLGTKDFYYVAASVGGGFTWIVGIDGAHIFETPGDANEVTNHASREIRKVRYTPPSPAKYEFI